jgi:flagellar hook-basal body protein
MLRSMFSAISGLRAHQTKMDVVGNNIANVNTVGFKSSTTVFEDTLSQVLRNGSAPTAGMAGTNPAQVGLGVKVAGITTNFGQGSAQNTGRATDFMIQGDGFFVTKSGNETLYTRAGSFDFDGAGNLVTPDGSILQGWTAKNGVVDPNAPVGNLAVPYGSVLAPSATSTGALVGNLPAGDPDTTQITTQISMYDAQGIEQPVSYTFTKNADDDWSLVLKHADGTILDTQSVTFDPATGTITGPGVAPDTGKFQFTPDPTKYPAWAGPVTIDLSKVTQFGGKSTVAATAQNGSALGQLQSFALSNDGTITGVYSNGLRQPIGQLALATFNNPSGLEKSGNSSYRVGDNSGLALVGQAGVGGRGTLSAGALEMSNVDLAEEFTGLIVAQRGFQANSKVITSSDEILQDLVNLKR